MSIAKMIEGGPTSHVYFSQRLRLHYVDWGNVGAPPLLLIHGGRDHCRNWDWVAQALRRDHHVIAPDLRGHGDSEWAKGATYDALDYVYDIAQLVHQTKLRPITIIGHSMGAPISLLYAGIYPEAVNRLVAIEGMGPGPQMLQRRMGDPQPRLQSWIEGLRRTAGRIPRRYSSLEAALKRMQEANPHLSDEQARHLTIHGTNQNEDGSYSWKFDNYIRAASPVYLPPEDAEALHGKITCPVLLVVGSESWASNPAGDGRIERFQNARAIEIEGAGHWVHHDRLDAFLHETRPFLAG